MTASSGFMAQVADVLVTFGPVSFRRMFGGAGVYADGLMFALIDADVLYFKVDADSRRAYEAEDTGPFTYMTKHGAGSLDSYWRVPERLFDEPEEMAEWARQALSVARSSAAQRNRPKQSGRPPEKKARAGDGTGQKRRAPPRKPRGKRTET